MASGVFSRLPDPANGLGHLYATAIGSTAVQQLAKNYSVPGTKFGHGGIGAASIDPWVVGGNFAANPNQWGWVVVGAPPAVTRLLDIHWNSGGALDGPWVFVPVKVLDKSRLYLIEIQIETSGNWVNIASLGIEGALVTYQKSTGTLAAPTGNKQFFSLAASTRHDLTFFDASGPDTPIDVDNSDYNYVVVLRVTDTAGQGNLGTICRPRTCQIQTLIREASHVY